MAVAALNALSPLDGRYAEKTAALREIFSEYNLIQCRLKVELAWFKALANEPGVLELPKLPPECLAYIDYIQMTFGSAEAKRIKELESELNHDVKAVEVFLREAFQKHDQLKHHCEFIHFGCTSEDINNVAYALMLRQGLAEVITPQIEQVHQQIKTLALESASIPMLSRTHGQPASPTTIGKELANFSARLEQQIKLLGNQPIQAKFNGAVGNYNAHCIAYPKVDWPAVSQKFIESLELNWLALTTQIEPHDYLCDLCHTLCHIHHILLDFSKDVWGYISLDYFQQQPVAGEVGSSTMPHKVNPIDFENAEGNFGLANALLYYFAQKLPKSRWQRDLSDSTVLRNLGVAFGYSSLGYQSLVKGLNKLTANKAATLTDLYKNWSVLTEAIQTVMRRFQCPDAYNQLKNLSRGKTISEQEIKAFIQQLEIPEEMLEKLEVLTPQTYIGMAVELAKKIDKTTVTPAKKLVTKENLA